VDTGFWIKTLLKQRLFMQPFIGEARNGCLGAAAVGISFFLRTHQFFQTPAEACVWIDAQGGKTWTRKC
jgi:hypothetical protein